MAVKGEDVVKSAGRVFEVLEFFDRAQESLTASQVERALNYPQSSTLALLKSMVKLGYLSFDRISKSYFPTLRVARLGQAPGHGPDRRLSQLADEMSLATGEWVALSCQNDLEMQFLQVSPGQEMLAEPAAPGDTIALFGSVIGLTALAERSDDDIVELAGRVNRRFRKPTGRADAALALQQARAIRRAGYGTGRAGDMTDVSVLAWAVRQQAELPPVILSICGPSRRIETKAAQLIEQVGRWLAPPCLVA